MEGLKETEKIIMRYLYGLLCPIILGVVACTSTPKEGINPALFTSLTAAQTHIDFINQLTYDRDFNIYTYRNFYNGGGVALGDVNQDSLLDVYFTSNLRENKLYLNTGDFKFEDITIKAGVAGTRAWSTGVSMADINGDGLLDIYVCNSGDVEGDNKQNELFINNGDLTFSEKAEEYGLADRGYSTHAAFFDYDKDGDLDCYLLNNSYQAIGSFNLRKNERPIRDSVGGDKLYRNDEGHFHDVSEEAGIYGSIIGFGLGVTVGDVNKDGWQDIFVSNDFFERDYLYINQQAGPDGKVTFKECLEEQIRSISGASMGADMADINNDTYAEIFVTEMLPEDNDRLKTKTTFENWNRYQYNIKNGYYHQFTRNMLHLNNGNNTFSEIGRLSGVHATDWSWGALITDLNNDGYKDIYVANGIYRDLTDQDYIQFISNEQTVKSIVQNDKVDFQQLIDSIPSERIPNYMYVNQGEYGFQNKAEEWGLAEPSHSNGAAYGDLDNDGDLDLVVNNVNMPAFIYRNEADKLLNDHHYLRFILHGEGKNTFAIGTQLTLWYQGKSFYQEQMPMRGFQSAVDPRPNFGLGDIEKVDSVIIRWPDDKISRLRDVATNQTLSLYQNEADLSEETREDERQAKVVFKDATPSSGLSFTHQENDFVDFDRDRLLFHMLSREGPALATADVNGDGLEDIYVGGARGQSGALYLQASGGSFILSNQEVFSEDSVSEDVAAVFFDADGDHDIDLYVGSGGSEFSSSSAALLDRLYLNNGKGEYIKSSQYLPTYRSEITGAVDAGDYDGDGDMDLFVGIRMQPFSYGLPTRGYILENDGTGNFTDATEKVAPSLLQAGMVTDGKWADINGDGVLDLIIVGEWMPVQVLCNEEGRLVDRTADSDLGKSHGWWNSIEAADMDGDGDVDFVVGNHGLNSRFKASEQKPLRMWVNDFDRNGAAEQIISQYNGEHAYPLVLRHDLLLQMPGLKKKYLKYEQYKNQQTEDIFVEEQLAEAVKHELYTLESSLLINEGGKLRRKALPIEAQFSPVYGVLLRDFDKDGQQDILLGGNFYAAKPEVGRYDASYGLLLKGDGKHNFKAVKAEESGLNLQGELREIRMINIEGKPYILLAVNDQPLKLLAIQDSFSVLTDK